MMVFRQRYHNYYIHSFEEIPQAMTIPNTHRKNYYSQYHKHYHFRSYYQNYDTANCTIKNAIKDYGYIDNRNNFEIFQSRYLISQAYLDGLDNLNQKNSHKTTIMK